MSFIDGNHVETVTLLQAAFGGDETDGFHDAGSGKGPTRRHVSARDSIGWRCRYQAVSHPLSVFSSRGHVVRLPLCNFGNRPHLQPPGLVPGRGIQWLQMVQIRLTLSSSSAEG